MKSCLYLGKVLHRRFSPVVNTFGYRLFLVYLDLAEPPQVFDIHPLWSAEHVKRTPMTRGGLTKALLTYPLMTRKVTGMIYRQALRLRFKGAPVHAHPKKSIFIQRSRGTR